MGYIKDGNDSGSEGSEGSEGNESAVQMAGLTALGLEIKSLKSAVVARQFVKIQLSGASGLTPAEVDESNKFWDEVKSFGILDSVSPSNNGETVVVLSVVNEKEAQDLISKEPNVTVGKLKVSSLKSL